MFTFWVIAGCILGAIAAIVVWTMIVALIVTWVEERNQHRHHPAG